MSGARYFRVVQADTPLCSDDNFRSCGDVLADQALVRALELVAQETEPSCRVGGLRGWSCSTPDAASREQYALSNPPANLRDPATRNLSTVYMHLRWKESQRAAVG